MKSTALLCGSGTEETSDLFRDVLTREVLDTGTPVVSEHDEDLRDCIDLGTRMIDAFIATVPGPDLVLGVEVAFARDEHQLAIILHDVNTASTTASTIRSGAGSAGAVRTPVAAAEGKDRCRSFSLRRPR